MHNSHQLSLSIRDSLPQMRENSLSPPLAFFLSLPLPISLSKIKRESNEKKEKKLLSFLTALIWVNGKINKNLLPKLLSIH